MLIFFGLKILAQNETSKWIFASYAGLDFMNSPPTILNNGQNSSGTSSEPVISDAAGNLLFYHDGGNLRNQNHTIMSNGSSISPGYSNQGSIIVKQPGNNSLYYYFSTQSSGIRYSIVDMSLAAGLGSVTVRQATLTSIAQCGKIAATKHCNGTDVWIMTLDENTNIYRAQLLTPSGLNSSAITSTIGVTHVNHGMMKFSPSGKRLASSSFSVSYELCDFNSSTGNVSNAISIGNVGTAAIGLEFSPDETKLYGNRSNNCIWQWDLCAGSATAITASQYSVAVNGSMKVGMQLASDGKIYVTRYGQQALAAINNPNASGSSCNFVEVGQSIAPNICGMSLPNFVSSYFYHPQVPPIFTNSLTLNQNCRTLAFTAPPSPTSNCAASNYSVTGIVWNFGDPASSASNTSVSNNPMHEFSAPGVYTVQLIFNYVCGADTLKKQITINGPILNITNDPLTCASFGTATVALTGGTGPFSYSWSTSSQTNAIASNLTAGNYTLTVFDTGASCFNTTTTTILTNTVFTAVVSNNSLACNGINTGSANVLVNGGTGSYSYSWIGTSQTSPLVTNLPAGFYTLTATDLLGPGPCSITKTLQIIQPPPLLVSIAPSSFSNCVGNSISLTGNCSGGIAPFTYSWSAGPASSAYTVAQTIAGNYIYTINAFDANNCLATNAISLFFSNAPILTVNSSTICTGYTATLNISGATSYTWYPGAFVGSTFTTSPNATTNYSITGYLTGCTSNNQAIATVYVIPPPSLTLALSSNTLCEHAFNGSPNTITLTSSGAATYTLQTHNHISNPNPSGPSSSIGSAPPYTSGVTTATLIGSNGFCSVSNTFSFAIIPNPTVTISSPTPVICAGQSFTYTNQGATSYTWSNATPGLTTYSTGQVAVANPSINSVFSVYGGSLGCNSALKTTTITVNPLPVFSLSPGTATVCLNSKMTLAAFGDPTSYTWSPYAGLSSMFGSTVSASPTSLQTYTALGSLNSCTSTALITVSVLPLPSPTAIAVKPELCLNELIILKGFGGLTYRWDGPVNLMYAGQTVTFVASSRAFSGTYTLTVSDVNGCVASNQVGIKINPLPNADLSISIRNGCVPFTTQFKMYTQNEKDTNIVAYWQLENQTFYGKQFSYLFNSAKTYSIFGHYSDTLTTCKNSATYVVEAYPLPIADFMFEPEKPVEGFDEVSFINTSSGDELSKFNWYFINNQGYKSENKNTSYLFNELGEYPVAMVVQNKWGCADTMIKAINVESDFNAYVPNAFTPNEDNLNDVFLPIVRGVKLYELQIFDRWGKLIFSSQDLQYGWDGYFNGEPEKVDIYTWKISLSTNSGLTKLLTGHVTLNR